MNRGDHLSSFREAMNNAEPLPQFSALAEKGEDLPDDEFEVRLKESEQLQNEGARHAEMTQIAKAIAESGNAERAYYVVLGIGTLSDRAEALGAILPALISAKNTHAWEAAQRIVESQIADGEKERIIKTAGAVDWKFSEDMRRDWARKRGLR